MLSLALASLLRVLGSLLTPDSGVVMLGDERLLWNDADTLRQRRENGRRSSAASVIVPTLSPGTHVSTSKNDINYVVTEFGVAQLRGKSAKQRAQELIGIAHPNFRAELTEQARRLHLL